MSLPVIGDAYDRYMKRVKIAQAQGSNNEQIVIELRRERDTLKTRAVIVAALLSMDPNIYKKREAIRAADECMSAIERICDELLKERTPCES